MATISITREELLAKLNDAKARAERHDAATAKAHKKDEAAALAKFREKLREALKWDYGTATKKLEWRGVELKRPTCPLRQASRIELAIKQVEMDGRKRFNLKTTTDWINAASWLPESERPKASVCD